MQAYEIRDAFGLDHLTRVERPEPTPGPGQVRVRVRAVSLNYRDLMMVEGRYNPRQPLPLVPCSDGVGMVDAVGEGVRGVKVGERVAGLFVQRWVAGSPSAEAQRSTLGGPLDGMLAQQVVLEAGGVVGVPEHLDDVEASTLPCAALTAWSALVGEGRIAAGDTVLVQGTGGVSSFALEIARMHGARVIATTSSPAKAETCWRAGPGGSSTTDRIRSGARPHAASPAAAGSTTWWRWGAWGPWRSRCERCDPAAR